MKLKLSMNCNDNNLRNKEYFILDEELIINFNHRLKKPSHKFENYSFTIPKNFKSDGYSSPTELFKRTLRCSILHDYLYSIQYKNDRKLCDKIFLHAMLNADMPVYKAYATYLAVRIGGRKAWNKSNNK